MILVFKSDPLRKMAQAAAILTRFPEFNARIGTEPGGGFHVVVPSGRRPLSVLRILKERDPSFRWQLYGLDDDGAPVVPIVAADQ